jgi:NADH dehydrogenase (ubiquinone) 1 alpha/beta subcomplex 1
LRSLSTDSIVPSDPFVNIELIPDDVLRAGETLSSGCFGILDRDMPILSDDDIYEAVASTTAFLRQVVNCEKKTGIVYKALKIICHYCIFETYSIDTKLKILSTAFDQIRNYSQADPREVFLMNVFIRSMSNDDNKNDITKDEVISRVLDVIQSYHKVAHYKVTEETHFRNELGFDDFDCGQVKKALYLEFKLSVPENDSCKQSIDYIYDNRMKRIDFEVFRKSNIIGDVFWPRPRRGIFPTTL